MAIEKITKKDIKKAMELETKRLDYLHDDENVLRTEYSDLDYILKGLRRGQTYLLGARPAMGKTAFALNLVNNISVINGRRVVYFSLNETKTVLVKKLISVVSCSDNEASHLIVHEPCDLGKCQNGVAKAMKLVEDSEIYINDTSCLSAEEIVSSFNSLTKPVDLIIVDSLQGLSGSSDDISGICMKLTKLSRKLNCPILILSKISRDADERDSHWPVIEDLTINRVQENVDNIMFLYRDEYYDIDSELKGMADIIVAQNKNGDRGGIISLEWLRNT